MERKHFLLKRNAMVRSVISESYKETWNQTSKPTTTISATREVTLNFNYFLLRKVNQYFKEIINVIL